MKRILYKKWIATKWRQEDGTVYEGRKKNTLDIRVDGTGQLSDYEFEGFFHIWGAQSEEDAFNNKTLQVTKALIEKVDGKLEFFSIDHIKFDPSYSETLKQEIEFRKDKYLLNR